MLLFLLLLMLQKLQLLLPFVFAYCDTLPCILRTIIVLVFCVYCPIVSLFISRWEYRRGGQTRAANTPIINPFPINVRGGQLSTFCATDRSKRTCVGFPHLWLWKAEKWNLLLHLQKSDTRLVITSTWKEGWEGQVAIYLNNFFPWTSLLTGIGGVLGNDIFTGGAALAKKNNCAAFFQLILLFRQRGKITSHAPKIPNSCKSCRRNKRNFPLLFPHRHSSSGFFSRGGKTALSGANFTFVCTPEKVTQTPVYFWAKL